MHHWRSPLLLRWSSAARLLTYKRRGLARNTGGGVLERIVGPPNLQVSRRRHCTRALSCFVRFRKTCHSHVGCSLETVYVRSRSAARGTPNVSSAVSGVTTHACREFGPPAAEV